MQCIKCNCKLVNRKTDNETGKCQWCRAAETKEANKNSKLKQFS